MEWDLSFAESGPRGLELMSQSPFDVVVSDMLMPGMSGAQFLNEVMRRHPRTARLVLSGHPQKELVLEAVGAAHQYLVKPCAPEVLKSALLRATALGPTLQSDPLRQAVWQMDRLPSAPALYAQFVSKLQEADASLEAVAEIVSQDPGLTANVLKVVNSAFFGFYGEVSNAAEAIAYLGLETIKAMVSSGNAFCEIESGTFDKYALDIWWMHSMQTALGARRVALAEQSPKKVLDDAFTAFYYPHLVRLRSEFLILRTSTSGVANHAK